MHRNNNSALTRILLVVLIFFSLLLISCGSDPSSGIVSLPAVNLQEDEDLSSQPPLDPIVIPIPGFTPGEKVIFPSQKLLDVEFPIPQDFPYMIAWVATFDEDDKPVESPSEVPEDGSRKVVAISSSGEDAIIPACLFELPGKYTLSAITFSPFSEELDELGYEDLEITIDGYCLALEFEEFDLPTLTTGKPENFRIRMRLVDDEKEIILDEDGNRPPTFISLQAENGIVEPSEGTTDDQGYFRATATLAEDKDYMIVTAIAEYLPEEDQATAEEENQEVHPLTAESDPRRMDRSEPSNPSTPNYSDGQLPYDPSCQDCSYADVIGDPHLYTFDRLRYDFHGAGEYILAKSLISDFEIQARFRPFSGSTSASMASAFAFRLGSNRLMISVVPTLEIWLDDQLLDVQSGDFIGLRDGYYLEYYDHSQDEEGQNAYYVGGDFGWIEISPAFLNSPSLALLELSVQLYDHDLRSEMMGLLGNHDSRPGNDLTARTGEQISADDYHQLYDIYGDSWRVLPTDSLFHYSSGQNTDTFFDPAFPQEIVQLDPFVRQGAEEICLQTGQDWGDRWSIEDCIYDVVTMGEEAVVAYGGTHTTDSGYTFTPFAGVGQLIDFIQEGQDLIVLDRLSSEVARLARVSPGGSISTIAEFTQPYTFQQGRGIVPTQNGYGVITDQGELLEVGWSGQITSLLTGIGSSSSDYTRFSNLVGDAFGHILLAKEDKTITLLQMEQLGIGLNSSPAQLLKIDPWGGIEPLLSGYFGAKLVGQPDDLFLLSESSQSQIWQISSGQSPVAVLDASISFPNTVVDGGFWITDLELRDDELLGILQPNYFYSDEGLGQGAWSGGVIQISGEGQISSVVRFPEDLSVELDRFLVDGEGYVASGCQGGSAYNCGLYRIERY